MSRSKSYLNLGIVRAPLFWLAVLYVVVGVAYAWVTPVFEKHDEDGHYGYILYLREHRALPPLLFADGFPSEYKQPPLYYVVAAILTAGLGDVPDPHRLLDTNPYMDFSVPGHRSDNRNVFLHPPHMTALVMGGRLVSLLFGLGTVLACYFLARQLFSGTPTVPLAAAAVVGFQPKFLYMATAVNNDAAIAFFGAAIVALLVYRLQGGDWPHFALLLGGLLGLASLTKVSGLIFVPLVGLALLVHRGWNRAAVREGVLVLVVALLVGGWWYARNALVYGDPLSIDTHIPDEAGARPLQERLENDLASIEHTFWANPSRTFVSRIWLDEVLIWWGRASLGFLALGLVLNRGALQIGRPAWILLFSWPATFLLLLLIYWTRQAAWAYGRLLLPAIAPLALLFVLGWWSVSPRRWRAAVLTFGAGTVVVASALIPFVSIWPLYRPWRGGNEREVEHPLGTLYVDPLTQTGVARLVGYTLPEPFVFPGTHLPVELCWRPLSQTDVPYAVFVHLLDLSPLSEGQSPGIWGSRRTYPGLGNLPSDRWPLGETFCDRVLVPVSPAAPTPWGAVIEVGFIDPETGERLQYATVEGDTVKTIDMMGVKGVPVLSPGNLPATEGAAQYVLGDAVGLGRAQVAGGAEGSVTLTLTWQSLEAVAYDAITFVHLKGADGSTLAQVDRQPLDGRFPTSYWLPGQIVTDVLRLPLAPGAGDAPLTLHVGMYTWPSLERLAVVDGAGVPQPDDVIVIPVPPPGRDGDSAGEGSD